MLPIALSGLLTLFALPSFAQSPEQILAPLKKELGRALRELRYEGYPRPYFISLRVNQDASADLGFRDGEIVFKNHNEEWNFYPEVRVGNHDFDQTPDSWVGSSAEWPVSFPSSENLTRHYVWNALDETYKDACRLFYEKKAQRAAEGIPDYVTDDFSQEKKTASAVALKNKPRDLSWESLENTYGKTLAEISKTSSADPKIYRFLIKFGWRRSSTYILTSEGSEVSYDRDHGEVYLSLYGRSQKGLPLHLTQTVSVNDSQDLPDRAALVETIGLMKKNFSRLYSSPQAQSAMAPCILDPSASAELFLAFISRLEGERQRDPEESQAFRNKINHPVLPDFLTVRDAPLMKKFGSVKLLGHYLFDEQAVGAQDVILVDNGILKNFLLSRRPVKNLLPFSNGHGRAASGQSPHARAANVLVESSKTFSGKELRRLLLDEVRRQNLPFGVIVEGIETVRQEDKTGSHQTFRAAARLLTLVYPDGRQELVHNGEIVGTPINLMQSIAAAGDDAAVHNALVGGPGGKIPTAVIAPSILISQIEIQKGSARPTRLPILKSPLEEKD
ncbi:MAG: hypothetical protein HY401_07740 [Elusimicrobia bacterium]|nr:hypothetical protein [Elusimicrobiota bacterium]